MSGEKGNVLLLSEKNRNKFIGHSAHSLADKETRLSHLTCVGQ